MPKKYVYVFWDKAVIRTADSKSSKAVGIAGKGNKYEYIISNLDKSWYCIRFGDHLRWISSKFCRIVED